MTRAECEQGHQYDADLYSTCPYCHNFQTINFGGVPVGQAGETVPGEGIPMGQAGVAMPGRDSGAFLYQRNSREKMIMEDDTRTRPPRGYERRVDEDNKTKGMIQKKNGIEPVVGWLVCIKGSEKGRDYRLYGRINTVGRDERMDVCIRGDQGITREIHVRIGYDPRKNNFHIIPANSSNNTYVNDEPIYIPTKLEAYDVIELGETRLLFLPLCNQKFSWSEGLGLGGKEDALI